MVELRASHTDGSNASLYVLLVALLSVYDYIYDYWKYNAKVQRFTVKASPRELNRFIYNEDAEIQAGRWQETVPCRVKACMC